MVPYYDWVSRIRRDLASMSCGDVPPYAAAFFRDHYRPHLPAIVDLPHWRAMDWTPSDIAGRIGSGTVVETQWGRAANPAFELESHSLKRAVPFWMFRQELEHGVDNDVYLTAQNTGANQASFSGLWDDVGDLPAFLHPDPRAGFLWLGRNTLTPLHHDETNNLMCQVLGRKHVRLFPPEDRDQLSPFVGVHSHLSWVTDQMVYDRHLNVMDVWLEPGQALFLPIGWWHCVRSVGMALTIVYTSFLWSNFWGRVTD